MAELNLASMTDASLRALHGELVSELRRAPSPAQWWLAWYQAISLLKGNAPRLFEAFTAHYRHRPRGWHMRTRALPRNGPHLARASRGSSREKDPTPGGSAACSPALFRTRGDPSRPLEPWAICAFAHESGGVSPMRPKICPSPNRGGAHGATTDAWLE
jgi:hypothetical protein